MQQYESKLWQKINKMMGNRWWATRIESPMSLGIPDVLFAIDNRSGWMELKSISHLKSGKIAHISTLTDAQIAWLQQGNGWLVIEVRDILEIFLVRGRWVDSQDIDMDKKAIPMSEKWAASWLAGELRG